MKSSDNKGFTLLEVLIAVIILAIVIVPMLHSFVSSHRMNARSKQYMRATTLAQDEMEIFEKEKLEDLQDTSKFSYTVTGPDTLGEGRYEFLREGINNDHSGASVSKFDVLVKLDPERANTSDRYYDTNSQALFYMNTIGSTDSAVYVQSIRNASTVKGYDDNIYEYFSANKSAAGIGSTWGTQEFDKDLTRRIKVKIYHENNGLNIATIVKVTYEYVLCTNNVMPAGYQMYSEESVIFNNSAQGIDDDGNLPELKNVYLFYAPRYKGYSTPKTVTYPIDGEPTTLKTNEDWIIIDNEAELPINVYVIRQDIFKDGSTTEIEPTPYNYQPKIEIHDAIDADHTVGNYYTNLNIDSAALAGIGGQVDFSKLKDNNNTSRVYSNTEALSVIEPKPLDGAGSTQSEVKDRIYTMTVEVYNGGADRTTASPIVRMTGSKLE
ncbi:MAG: prepilin-type N-terminal cleavage/methylation domain-containing protein [Lachnospiraceae bacterium]|nr:prepilin-type N-terminal cleavage/methylation domain-containing protein [Lachnospiraceae bacterium]